MSPVSNVTDCHNLVAKRNKKKSDLHRSFQDVRNLVSCNELTRGDQTVMNPSINNNNNNNCLTNRPRRVQQGRSSTRLDQKHI